MLVGKSGRDRRAAPWELFKWPPERNGGLALEGVGHSQQGKSSIGCAGRPSPNSLRPEHFCCPNVSVLAFLPLLKEGR